MKNLNDYKSKQFYESFKDSDITLKVTEDFDCLLWDKHFVQDADHNITPREYHGNRSSMRKTKFSMVPFYYLLPLLENNSAQIYDLGCGWNIFKKYIPAIIGVGAEDSKSCYFYGDKSDLVDDNYIKNHCSYFESVFSINALHFSPIENIRQRVLDFSSMVKTNGKGFIALNSARMIEQSADDRFKNGTINIDRFVRQELDNMPFQYLIFDVDFTVMDEYMNGNIRLVFKK